MTVFKKATFSVGGFGIRFLKTTKAMSKNLLKVFNKPLIQCSVEEAIAVDLDDVLYLGVFEEDDTTGEQATKDHKRLQSHFKKKSQDCVFLTLVSKNEFAEVNNLSYERNDHPPYWDDFALAEISKISKSKSIF